MPDGYTLETLPIPKDNNIHFNTVPAHQMASIRFSGYFNQIKSKKTQQRLEQWIKDEGLETEGDFIIAGYNPPWIPGFLARNEVLIRIRGKINTNIFSWKFGRVFVNPIHTSRSLDADLSSFHQGKIRVINNFVIRSGSVGIQHSALISSFRWLG